MHWSAEKREKRKETPKNAPLSGVPVGARRGDGLNDDCFVILCFRERGREREAKRAVSDGIRDEKDKKTNSQIDDIFSLTSGRCRSSRRRGGPPISFAPAFSSVAAVSSRSSSAAIAAAVAAATVNSPALVGAGGLGRLFLFFCVDFLFSLDERRIASREALVAFFAPVSRFLLSLPSDSNHSRSRRRASLLFSSWQPPGMDLFL